MYNVGGLTVRFSQRGHLCKLPFSWELVIGDELTVCWSCELKADKELFLKTVNFMSSGPGGIAKFKASFQPSYFAIICFPSDEGEDFQENYDRFPWKLWSGRY